MDDLYEAMKREIHVMREILASVQLEKRALLQRDCVCLSMIKEDRIAMLESMRKLRVCILKKMDRRSIESEFYVLKDQIVTLVKKIQETQRQNRTLSGDHRVPIPIQKTKPKAATLVKTQVIDHAITVSSRGIDST